MSLRSFVTSRLYLGTQILVALLTMAFFIGSGLVAGNIVINFMAEQNINSQSAEAALQKWFNLTDAINSMQLAVVSLQEDISHYASEPTDDTLERVLQEAN